MMPTEENPHDLDQLAKEQETSEDKDREGEEEEERGGEDREEEGEEGKEDSREEEQAEENMDTEDKVVSAYVPCVYTYILVRHQFCIWLPCMVLKLGQWNVYHSEELKTF